MTNKFLFALKKKLWLFSLLSLFLLTPSCHHKPKWVIKVGVDPMWFPLELQGKEPNVFAFSNDVLQEISRAKGIKFERLAVGWDALLDGLQNNRYEAILSSMQPFVFNQKKYQFSRIYLPTGPVLIVPRSSSFNHFEKGQEKEIGVVNKIDERFLVEHYPEVTVKIYTSIPTMLFDIVATKLDGALVSAIYANTYVQDLYEEELKVVPEPLTEEGLRLITLHGKHQDIVRLFNEGLEQIMQNGQYEALLHKWKVGL